MRPLPTRLYDRERAVKEYGEWAPEEWKQAPAIPDHICGICYHPFDQCSHCSQPALAAPRDRALRERIEKLARDIGTVLTVSERRQIFDTAHEFREHQQMRLRLGEWRTTLLDVLALFADPAVLPNNQK